MSYEGKSLEDLEGMLRDIDTKRAALKAEAIAVTKAVDVILVEQATRRKLEGMSDAERMKLVQMIEAEGVKSGETVSNV